MFGIQVDSNMGIWESISGMKTTIELPEVLYRRVKAKSSLGGLAVRAVTQRLFELWLEGHVSIDEAGRTGKAEKQAWADKWVRETDELSAQISKKNSYKRLARNILKEDRR